MYKSKQLSFHSRESTLEERFTSPTKAADSMVVQVVVYGFGGDKMMIDLCNDEKELHKITVLDLKKKIAQKLPGKPDQAVDNMQLVFATTRLNADHKRLSEYGIVHKSTIQMVMTLDGGLSL